MTTTLALICIALIEHVNNSCNESKFTQSHISYVKNTQYFDFIYSEQRVLDGDLQETMDYPLGFNAHEWNLEMW